MMGAFLNFQLSFLTHALQVHSSLVLLTLVFFVFTLCALCVKLYF